MSVEEQVQRVIAERLHVDGDRLSLGADFRKDLHCDDLKLLDLLVELESRFGVEIDERKARRLRTVKDACECVREAAN
ncbi:MAG: phosphopantetheine-binding protein [Bdellovibrionota bacterium]